MARVKDVTHLRSMDNPPEEMYEATLRDAIKILEDAGPSAAFMLVLVKEDKEADKYETVSAISTGTNHIPTGVILRFVAEWAQVHFTP